MASVTLQQMQPTYGIPPLSDQRKVDPASFSTLKCFDFEEIEAAGFDRLHKIEEFGNALKADGFVAIKMTPETEALVREAYKVLELYFEQPLEVKDRDNNHDYGHSGYIPKGLKEMFLFPPSFNKYPKGNPDFERAIEAYRTSLSGLAAQILEYISQYLKEPLEERAIIETGASHTLHGIHYPPLSAARSAAQGDQSAITLMPRGSAPRLELQQKNGAWIPVVVPEGYMIVRSGRQLWRKTAGELPEAIYRAVNPEGEAAKEKRIDMVFFASWLPDFDLTPLGSCSKRVTAEMSQRQKEDYLRKFPPVSVQQNHVARSIELGDMTDPPREELEELVKLGVILEPPAAFAAKHPDLFPNFIDWQALDSVEF